MVFFSCDKLINGKNRKSKDIKERYKIYPYYVLSTTSPTAMADCEGNSDLNVGTLDSIVPEEAQGNYNSNGTDNANDELKETNKTWEKCQQSLRYRNMYEQTMTNGVLKEVIQVCDHFHITRKLTKTALLKIFGSHKISLSLFLSPVLDIFKGKKGNHYQY